MAKVLRIVWTGKVERFIVIKVCYGSLGTFLEIHFVDLDFFELLLFCVGWGVQFLGNRPSSNNLLN